MSMSAAIFPHFPIALKDISEKDPPPTASLAYNSLIRQTRVSKKLRSMQTKPKSQPPFLKFLGEYKMPIAIKPLTKEK